MMMVMPLMSSSSGWRPTAVRGFARTRKSQRKRRQALAQKRRDKKMAREATRDSGRAAVAGASLGELGVLKEKELVEKQEEEVDQLVEEQEEEVDEEVEEDSDVGLIRSPYGQTDEGNFRLSEVASAMAKASPELCSAKI